MTPEQWRAVQEVLHGALGRASAERAAYVAASCAGDETVRREVESLLAQHVTADGFLEQPALVDPIGPAMSDERLARALAGRYAVERELGRGGMATVWLARDDRHRRQVAIKVLHPELSAVVGAERFLKEIELTAALQHPHVLPLFESGSADGLLWYVMPFVQGETLRERLTRERQLPVDDAVRIAREVASALDHAHRHGVVHRDVKPENILLGEDGQALVADFGIALAVSQASGMRLTQTGLSLGTPRYMAPEQAAGERAADARTDVWALGVVLYEMLAGEPPFTGASTQAIIARLMSEAPKPLATLRRSVPPHVEAAAHTALEKLPADRFASAAAFAAAPAEPRHAHAVARPDSAAYATVDRTVARRAVAMLAAGALAVAAIVGALSWTFGRASGRSSGIAAAAAARAPVRFVIDVDSGSLGNGIPAISPDGRTIVYGVERLDGSQLWARRLDELAARPLAGTDGAEQPFFSPDGQWVAFFANGAIRKVRLQGGPVIGVTDLPRGTWFAGGSWATNDTILFAEMWSGTLQRVPATGGTATRVPVIGTTTGVTDPHPLPGGRHVLVTIVDCCIDRMGVLDLATGRVRELGRGVAPRWVAGQLVYGTLDGALLRQPFDLDRLELRGAPEPIAKSGLPFLFGAATFDVSPSGAVVHRLGGSSSAPGNLRLVLVDRAGRELRAIPARVPWAPRFSPDGRRIAYGAFAPGHDSSEVWVTDLASGTTQRITTENDDGNDPQWSPDGRMIAYSAIAPGGKDVLLRVVDGGAPRVIAARRGEQFPTDWLSDGSAVLVTEASRSEGDAGFGGVLALPLDGSAPRPYLATSGRESGARASPDGRWVAYMSRETGRNEIYVNSYPVPGRKTLVSVGGGVHPAWRRDGPELYYWQADQLVAARLEYGPAGAPTVRERRVVFGAPYVNALPAMYDVSPDGQRFVIVMGHERANRLVVALDALGDGPEGRATRR